MRLALGETTMNLAARCQSLASSVWAWVSKHPIVKFGSLPLALVAFFVFFVVQPFNSDVDDHITDDVAMSWNTSMAKLGILPIFPPQEDFFVGDLWAVIVGGPTGTHLGRSLRIGHLDLLLSVKRNFDRRLLIDDGTREKSGDVASEKPSDNYVHPSLVAFPGISITRTHHSSGSSSLNIFNFLSSRSGDISDEINIPIARTYGVDAADAVLAVISFCSDPSTKIRCSDAYVRNLLAEGLDENAGVDVSAEKKLEVKIQLVTRVYLAKSIEHKTTFSGNSSFQADSRSANNSPIIAKTADNPEHSVTSFVAESKIQQDNSDKSEIAFSEQFPKELAFGFRAVTLYPIQ